MFDMRGLRVAFGFDSVMAEKGLRTQLLKNRFYFDSEDEVSFEIICQSCFIAENCASSADCFSLLHKFADVSTSIR